VRARVNPDVTLLLPLTYRWSTCHHNLELKKKIQRKIETLGPSTSTDAPWNKNSAGVGDAHRLHGGALVTPSFMADPPRPRITASSPCAASTPIYSPRRRCRCLQGARRGRDGEHACRFRTAPSPTAEAADYHRRSRVPFLANRHCHEMLGGICGCK
jgi:hypothetical protein